MRHSNHGLLRRIERTIIAKIFWMPVKLVADPDSGRSIAHACALGFWVAVYLISICANEFLRPPHYSFSHEIKTTPMMTRHTAPILRAVSCSTPRRKTAESGRIKSAEPLTSGEMRDTRSRLRAVKANT